MSKLFKLKEWLTVPEAAKYLSGIFEEEVTEADVLQLALDGHLRLSVYFVNHAKAHCGKVTRHTEEELAAAIESGNLPDDLKWTRFPKDIAAAVRGEPGGEEVPFLMSLRIDEDRYLTLDEEITTLAGTWDLPMLGGERLDVEHRYQCLSGGHAVTLSNYDGAFVEGGDGQICQLQEDFDDNEYQAGSQAALKVLKHRCAEMMEIDPTKEGAAEAESLLSRYMEDRKKFKEKRRTQPESENYYPAGGLPKDSVLVVRTVALRELEASIGGPQTGAQKPLAVFERAHVSDKLAILNQAAVKFWANADRDDRSTHPNNSDVAAWLVEHGFSQKSASSAATIIRPDWAPTGRKPEEW